MKLQNKVAIVTGGSRGIGAAIACEFASQGAKVVVNYLNSQEKADAVVANIIEQGGLALAVQADVSQLSGIDHLVNQACEAFGVVDILVNNAGWATLERLQDITFDDTKKQFELNVFGPIFLTQKISAIMPSGSVIINISSIAAKGGAGGSIYCATKAAINTLTKCYAAELGEKGIRVNAIAPGAVETDLYIEAGLAKREAEIIGQTPLKRLGQPDDIASLALFLASEDSSWITGEVIQISGGRFMS
ncbi:MAG: 3-oxoacyl-[acyl-carrier protein] reductase [Congregibacter sp.]|jgi:3-oxoacyl-[acyl-carrier protein] reductase